MAALYKLMKMIKGDEILTFLLTALPYKAGEKTLEKRIVDDLGNMHIISAKNFYDLKKIGVDMLPKVLQIYQYNSQY